MSMELVVMRLPDALVKKLISEPGLAEQVVGSPEHMGVGEDELVNFNYRDLDALLTGRNALRTALDQEGGTQVGDDFGYGPGWVFTATEVETLAKRLKAEAIETGEQVDPETSDQYQDFVAVFGAAAQARQGVLLVCS